MNLLIPHLKPLIKYVAVFWEGTSNFMQPFPTLLVFVVFSSTVSHLITSIFGWSRSHEFALIVNTLKLITIWKKKIFLRKAPVVNKLKLTWNKKTYSKKYVNIIKKISYLFQQLLILWRLILTLYNAVQFYLYIKIYNNLLKSFIVKYWQIFICSCTSWPKIHIKYAIFIRITVHWFLIWDCHFPMVIGFFSHLASAGILHVFPVMLCKVNTILQSLFSDSNFTDVIHFKNFVEKIRIQLTKTATH